MTTVTVGPGQQFTSIQAAVDANPGGTTFNILAGTYHESIAPKSGDVFNGAGIGQTILDGQHTLANGFDGGYGGAPASNNVTINGMTIENFTGNGILQRPWISSGWIETNNEIAFNGAQGIDFGNGDVFRNNIVHDNALNGLHEVWSQNLVIDNNDIYHNNVANSNPFTATSDTGGTKFNGGSNFTITNNKIHDTAGMGLWFDGNVQNVTISGNEIYNISYNGTGGAIDVEINNPQTGTAPDFHIFNNYIHDNASGVQLIDSGNVEVYNNAFVNNGVSGNGGAYQLIDEGNRGTAPNGLPYLNVNNSFHDNYVAAVNYAPDNYDSGYQNWKAQNNTYNNNTYYLVSSSSQQFVDENGHTLTAAQWQALGSFADPNSTFNYNGGTLPIGVGPRGGYSSTQTSLTDPTPTPPAAPTGLADAAIVNGYVNAANDTTTQQLTGSAEAGSTVSVYDGTSKLGTATVASNGSWSYMLGHLADGSHSLTATATDAAGTSAASAPLAFTVDTQAPAAPTLAAYSQAGSAVGSTSTLTDLVLKGTAEAGSTIAIADGSNAIGTATTSSTGSWSYDTGTIALGSHSFTATATDVAGNTSVASGVDSVTVVAATTVVAPTAPTLTVASNSLHVSPGGTIPLGLGVSVPNAGDNVTVTISGLPHYETITDNLDSKTFSGSSVTLTAAEVNSGINGGSGLSLSSSYHGHGHPTATLTVTATDTTTGVTSAVETITVVDPPGMTTGSSTSTSGDGWSWGQSHHAATPSPASDSSILRATDSGQTLTGNGGDDIFVIGKHTDAVISETGHGISTVVTTAKSYTLPTGIDNLTGKSHGSETLIGNDGNNFITGNNAKDTIDGGPGNDTIKVGTGANTLTGGSGQDLFIFGKAADHGNVITDFTVGQDELDLTGVLKQIHYHGNDPLADSVLKLVQKGANTEVVVDPHGNGAAGHTVVTLDHVVASTLTEGHDFFWHH